MLAGPGRRTVGIRRTATGVEVEPTGQPPRLVDLERSPVPDASLLPIEGRC